MCSVKWRTIVDRVRIPGATLLRIRFRSKTAESRLRVSVALCVLWARPLCESTSSASTHMDSDTRCRGCLCVVVIVAGIRSENTGSYIMVSCTNETAFIQMAFSLGVVHRGDMHKCQLASEIRSESCWGNSGFLEHTRHHRESQCLPAAFIRVFVTSEGQAFVQGSSSRMPSRT